MKTELEVTLRFTMDPKTPLTAHEAAALADTLALVKRMQGPAPTPDVARIEAVLADRRRYVLCEHGCGDTHMNNKIGRGQHRRFCVKQQLMREG